MAVGLENAKPRGRGKRLPLQRQIPGGSMRLGGVSRIGRGGASPRQDLIMRVGRKAREASPGQYGRATRVGGGGSRDAREGGGKGVQLPAQLQRRLQSGAIDRQQATRTARQRQTLQAKFGADWRNKLPGGAGAFSRVQEKLRENPDNPKLVALNKQLMNRRSKLLDAAQGAGQPRSGGRVNPRGRGMMNPPGESPARPRRRRVSPVRRAY